LVGDPRPAPRRRAARPGDSQRLPLALATGADDRRAGGARHGTGGDEPCDRQRSAAADRGGGGRRDAERLCPDPGGAAGDLPGVGPPRRALPVLWGGRRPPAPRVTAMTPDRRWLLAVALSVSALVWFVLCWHRPPTLPHQRLSLSLEPAADQGPL